MRTLKFRCFDNKSNKMIENCSHVQREGIEIMQFTGLLDRYGKEIYEGDILKFIEVDEDSALNTKKTYITQIKWIDDLAQWRAVSTSGIIITELHRILEVPYFFDQEIIGNIYENPGLIGDNK